MSQEILISKSDENPIIMYIIARESLNLTHGKLAIQVGHAVEYCLDLVKEKSDAKIQKWKLSGSRKVLLKASDNEFEKLKKIENHVLVVDAGLTEIEPNTETVIAFIPINKSDAPKLIKRLRLY